MTKSVWTVNMEAILSYQWDDIPKATNQPERNFPLDSPLKMPYIIDDKSLPIKAAGNLSVC